ncbi:hypothetical protein WG66_004076 [Moniliophthora roreri]|nr:hypothetical protein WG66_004076 [Moniliophthora roreri]
MDTWSRVLPSKRCFLQGRPVKGKTITTLKFKMGMYGKVKRRLVPGSRVAGWSSREEKLLVPSTCESTPIALVALI